MTDFVERRRYFRVEDKLELACKILAEGEQAVEAVRSERSHSQAFVDIENQIRKACEQVSQKLPEVSELFALLNRKVDLLLNAEPGQNLITDEAPYEQPVNLSACGIAFYRQELAPLGTRLLLTMRLKPGEHDISVLAYVIGCEPVKKGLAAANFLLRADFSGMNEEQQELLIQHVMQCQNRQLRDRRRPKS